MKQLQVTLPEDFRDDAEEVLENYSSDVSSSEAEKDNERVVQFNVTADSDQIDELTDELKSLEGVGEGDLSIRVIKQESLIRKGQETLGSASRLSQAEIYSQAQEAAEFDRPEWILIAISSIIASYGIILDNLIVVIGAMMVAPLLSPFISSSLSIAVGDRSLFRKSLKTGIISVVIAVFSATVALAPFSITQNATLELIISPSVLSVLLSVFVGAAAAVSFSTGLREQMAGVAVAIALIPPIASVGIGINLMDFSVVLNAGRLAAINLLSIIFAGFILFRVLGLRPSTYYKKKTADRLKFILPVSAALIVLLGASILVSDLQNRTGTVTEQEVKTYGERVFGDRMVDYSFDGSEAIYYVASTPEKNLSYRGGLEGVEIRKFELRRAD